MCVVSVCVAATLCEPTVEKRRVLSRVRRGALYLSHRRLHDRACDADAVNERAGGGRGLGPKDCCVRSSRRSV